MKRLYISVTELEPKTLKWLSTIGVTPENNDNWVEALTHGSSGEDRNYERLEFLGDRVLGIAIAEWLFNDSDLPEGLLSQRLNALVSRQTCARVAGQLGLGDHIRLGKQAHEDGGRESTNILGDAIEAMLGLYFLENGYEDTRHFIHKLWKPEFESNIGQSKHPKSALQEWAAGNRKKTPEYQLLKRKGPDHAASFTVSVSVKNVGQAEATASSKQEAEKLAAAAFLKDFT